MLQFVQETNCDSIRIPRRRKHSTLEPNKCFLFRLFQWAFWEDAME